MKIDKMFIEVKIVKIFKISNKGLKVSHKFSIKNFRLEMLVFMAIIRDEDEKHHQSDSKKFKYSSDIVKEALY